MQIINEQALVIILNTGESRKVREMLCHMEIKGKF